MLFLLFVLLHELWKDLEVSHSAWVHQEITINLSAGAGRCNISWSQKLLRGLGILPSVAPPLRVEMTDLQGHLPLFSLLSV